VQDWWTFLAASTSAGSWCNPQVLLSSPRGSRRLVFPWVDVLLSPPFFQIVIEKVLVNRTLSTLDVLVIGFVTISIFEPLLGILSTRCSESLRT
jgi:hypothetical protein